MSSRPIKLQADWLKLLAPEFEKPYFKNLAGFLRSEKQKGKIIYPPGDAIFAALNHTPPQQVRVVILGQDPYHGPGQAHGFCFSVPDGVAFPPSLLNIFKEIEQDTGTPIPKSGNLTRWADEGVLLLNAILTVEKGLAGSHQNKGWEQFTDHIIRQLNNRTEPIVFLLWGNFARQKGALINNPIHLVLSCGHPSPLSAARGHWFGNRHFSKTNAFLVKNGFKPIKW